MYHRLAWLARISRTALYNTVIIWGLSCTVNFRPTYPILFAREGPDLISARSHLSIRKAALDGMDFTENYAFMSQISKCQRICWTVGYTFTISLQSNQPCSSFRILQSQVPAILFGVLRMSFGRHSVAFLIGKQYNCLAEVKTKK